MTQRSAFVLEVRAGANRRVRRGAPKGLAGDARGAPRAAGIRNYTIFRNGTQMFGYFESDDLEAASALHGAAGRVG